MRWRLKKMVTSMFCRRRKAEDQNNADNQNVQDCKSALRQYKTRLRDMQSLTTRQADINTRLIDSLRRLQTAVMNYENKFKKVSRSTLVYE